MIPVINIYYMLSYSYDVLNEQGYKKLSSEKFHRVEDLCARILIKGISNQLKRGLGQEYVAVTSIMQSVKGKIDISSSIKSKSILKKQLVCAYDEFSVNSYLNKILKTTMLLLLKADIESKSKQEIRKLLVYFDDVEEVDPKLIDWHIKYHRNNQTYRMLVSICYLVIKGLLQNQNQGELKIMDFIDDENMNRLYERFILKYYQKEHPEFSVKSAQIAWQLDDEFCDFLPNMQSDIMISNSNKILIIDAKYYNTVFKQRYDVYKHNSSNLYQIFTYVKNKQEELKNQDIEVSGLLLYAKTDEEIYPKEVYRMSGNKIGVNALDLNCDFSEIRRQLETLINEWK